VTFFNSGDKYTDDSGYSYTGARNWTTTEMDDVAAMIQVWDNKIDDPYGPRNIKMYVMWSNLGSGVLGSSMDEFAYSGGKAWTCGEYVWRKGVNYANSYADVFYQYGTGFTWHSGSDNPGGGEYDFRSVVCHEIGHTLGFNGTYNSFTDKWSASGITEWDARLRDAATGGNRPIAGGKGTPHNFNQTANPCYWDGNYSKVANDGNRVAVYAPSPFNSGSSLYHLNDSSFPNALMKHAIGAGVTVREPSALEWEIMKDIGWAVITDRTWSKGAGTLKWSASANWTLDGVPDRTNCAIFTSAGLANGDIVDLDGNRTVDSLTIDSSVSFTIGGASGALTLNKGSITRTPASSGVQTVSRPVALVGTGGVWDIAGAGELAVSGQVGWASGVFEKRGAGALTIGGALSYGSGASLAVSGGTVNVNTDAGGADPNKYWRLTVNVGGSGSSVSFGATQHLGALNLSAGGKGRITGGGGKVLVTKALWIDPNGSSLDLNDGDLIVRYQPGSDPVDQIVGWVRSGLNNYAWNGSGIVSSAAANDADQLTTIGVIDNALYGYGSFAGQQVDGNAVLAKHTWYGDADLNGEVNMDDYVLWEGGLGGSGTGWLYGDFDYNSEVNMDDYLLWEGGLTGQTGILSDTFQAPLPEPATMALFGACAWLALLRRRGPAPPA